MGGILQVDTIKNNNASTIITQTNTTTLTFGSSGQTIVIPSGTTFNASSASVNLPSISLTTGVTGTLPIANGGTNLTTYTTGDLLYASNATTLTKLAVGTSTQVLGVSSGAPAWTTVSSDYVRLATATIAANTASVTFDGYFSSTYDTYIIYGNAVEQDATSRLRLRVRKANADVTSANYYSVGYGFQSSGSADDVSVSALTYFDLSNLTGGNTLYRTGFQTIIYNPLTTYNQMIKNTTTYSRDNGYVEWLEFAGYCNNNQNALSGVTYYPSTGNFDSGTIVLYGVKK